MPNVSMYSDYTAEQTAIDRRRKMAELLQQQSMQPMDTNQTAGGWVLPVSPYASLAKILQGYQAGAGMNAADTQEKALGQKYKTDLTDTLSRAMQAGTGTPERAAQMDPQEMQQSQDQGTSLPPNIPAQAPDRSQMASILMQHPATQAMGMQQLSGDMQRQALVAALGQGQASSGQPTQQGQPGAQQTTVGGPAGGVPMAAWIQADPTGKAYMEQLAKDSAASKTLTRFSPGGGLANQSGQVVVSAPFESGRATTYGPNGPTQGLVPGAVGAQTALGTTPLEKVINSDQTVSYVPKAQLAAGAGQPMPGQPRIGNYPGDAPSAAAAATGPGARFNAPDNATAEGMARVLSGQGKPFSVSSLTGDPALAQNGGLGNAPKFGQTQPEQVQQAGQTEAVKETASMVAKNLQDNYNRLRDVPQQLQNIEAAKAIVPQAKGFMGPAGESLLGSAKFLNDRLGTNINVTGVKGAEELRTRIFMNVMDNLKKMDAQPSQLQQQIMQQALGSLGTDPQALPKMLDAYAGALKTKVDIYHQQVDEAKTIGVNWPHRIKMPAESASTDTSALDAALAKYK